MNVFNEETALSLLFANTKRKRRSVDLVTLAKACRYLVDLYGSREAVAKRIGLSTEMIRELMLPLKLPKELQKLVSKRQLDSVDKVKQLATIENPKKQIEIAEEFLNISTTDVRDVKRLIDKTDLSPQRAKEIILEAKPKDLHIFMMDFNEETYRMILQHSRNRKIDPAQFVKEIVLEWLEREKTIDEE